MPDLVIRGGTVVVSDGAIRADIAIEDRRISAVAPELPGCVSEIDATGLTVFPGLIDVHVHFNEPGRTEWEGGASGSAALAAGGGTLFFDMPLNSSPCTVDGEGFDKKRDALARESITDFALWGGIVPGNRDKLEELAQRGVIGFKAFMSDSGLPEFARADDLTLLEGMRTAARLNLPVSVHAESEELTKAMTGRIRAAGGKGVRDYLESRPVVAEVDAIQRAALLAMESGARLHIVHVSSGRGVAAALEARARGADVTIETCPHYLFFTGEDMIRIGAVAKCAPPLRTEAEREALWRHLMAGDVDIVASDHSPSSPDLKQREDFFEVWGGIASVQTTLATLIEAGHHGRGLPLHRIAQLTATTPARRFGIPRKGSIEIGYDADLTLIDTCVERTIAPETLLYRHKLSPYIGSTLRGVPRLTMLRGGIIFEDGRMGPGGRGKLVTPRRQNK